MLIVDLREDKTERILIFGYIPTADGYVLDPAYASRKKRKDDFDTTRVRRIEILSDTQIKLIYMNGTKTILTMGDSI